MLYHCLGGHTRTPSTSLAAKLVKGVLEGLHNTLIGGHMEELKTLEKVRARFYWPGQRKEVVGIALYITLGNLPVTKGETLKPKF